MADYEGPKNRINAGQGTPQDREALQHYFETVGREGTSAGRAIMPYLKKYDRGDGRAPRYR